MQFRSHLTVITHADINLKPPKTLKYVQLELTAVVRKWRRRQSLEISSQEVQGRGQCYTRG